MHAEHEHIFRNTLTNLRAITKTLGNPPEIGLALLAKHVDDDAWSTVQELSELVDVSEDTVRRRLSDLVSLNRVLSTDRGGRRLYRLRPAYAKRVLESMKWDHTLYGKVPEAPQNAVADCD